MRANLRELDDLRRGRSKTRCRHKNFQSPLHKHPKRVLFRFHPDTTRRLFGIASSDFEFGGSARCHKLQKGQSKTFCRLLQRIMGRMSSNKNADIELESFLLDPDGSEGMKGLGKGRRNVIVFNCKKVAR